MGAHPRLNIPFMTSVISISHIQCTLVDWEFNSLLFFILFNNLIAKLLIYCYSLTATTFNFGQSLEFQFLHNKFGLWSDVTTCCNLLRKLQRIISSFETLEDYIPLLYNQFNVPISGPCPMLYRCDHQQAQTKKLRELEKFMMCFQP